MKQLLSVVACVFLCLTSASAQAQSNMAPHGVSWSLPHGVVPANNGYLRFAVSWRNETGGQFAEVTVPVAPGESAQDILDKVASAFYADPRFTADWTIKVGPSTNLHAERYAVAKRDTVKREAIRVIAPKTPSKPLATPVLLKGGNVGRITIEPEDETTRTTIPDSLSVGLSIYDSPETWDQVDIFTVSAVDGFSAQQIVGELASAIDMHPIYSAYSLDNTVVISGFNVNFGVQLDDNITSAFSSMLVVVPEPTAISLMLMGSILLGVCHRRKRSALQ